MTTLALCIISGHPERLPDQCRSMLHHIGELSKSGAVNDISYNGPYNEWIIGFDHAFYRLGIRDSKVLSGLQVASILLIAGLIARLVWNPTTPRGLSVAIVSLFSVLFLYHRLYDAVIFALPLTYAAARVRTSQGRARLFALGSILAMLVVIYMRRKSLGALSHAAPGWGIPGRFIEALILPSATWLTLAAMLLLWLGYPEHGGGAKSV